MKEKVSKVLHETGEGKNVMIKHFKKREKQKRILWNNRLELWCAIEIMTECVKVQSKRRSADTFVMERWSNNYTYFYYLLLWLEKALGVVKHHQPRGISRQQKYIYFNELLFLTCFQMQTYKFPYLNIH